MNLPVDSLLQGGKYKIIRFISSGGFGCTYEAEHVLLEKRVAIKEFFVKDFCNRDESNAQITVGTISKKGLVEKLRGKFIDEAKALCKLQHPGIVSVSDVFEENGTAYFVMDFVDGKSLSEIVREKGAFPEEQAVRYIREVATALQYVHDNNRLHLDIKPGNIMVDSNDNPILIDFGASKQYDEAGGENTSTLMGKTPGYAPPEQMSNSVMKFLPATDVYALGATLYKLLTGKTPIDANMRISGEELDPLPEGTSEATRNAVEAAMEINKNKRTQSIAEFLKYFEDDNSAAGAAAATAAAAVAAAGVATAAASDATVVAPASGKRTIKKVSLGNKSAVKKSAEPAPAPAPIPVVAPAPEPEPVSAGVATPASSPAIEPKPTPAPQKPNSGDPKPKKNKLLPVILIAASVLLLLGAAAGVYFIWFNKSDKGGDGEQTTIVAQTGDGTEESTATPEEGDGGSASGEVIAQGTATSTAAATATATESETNKTNDAAAENEARRRQEELKKQQEQEEQARKNREKEEREAEEQRLQREKEEEKRKKDEEKRKAEEERQRIIKMFDMVTVQGGTFKMGATQEQGSGTSPDEKPVHTVTVSTFKIGRFEVTQKQWIEIMGSNPSNWNGENLPVEQVSWNDVQEFIRRLNAKTGKNYRLPTEAEWEFAARGGNNSRGYKYSGGNTLTSIAWFHDNSGGKPHPVGTKGANELGIYDMTGNVLEWCSDYYDANYYNNSPANNPKGASSGSERVFRGVSWSNQVKSCRISNRSHGAPNEKYNTLGFRLAMD